MMQTSASAGKGASFTYAEIGDAVHAVAMLSAITFAVAVSLYAASDKSNLFDSQWKIDGFCVAGKDTPYWTSHDLCLYFDVAMAAVLAALYILLRTTPGMEAANKYIPSNIMGLIAHGMGHGFFASKLRELGGDMDQLSAHAARPFWERLRNESVTELLSEELPAVIFWLGLIYASTPGSKKSTIFLLSLLARVGQYFTPAIFGFTYVQTILMILFSFSQTQLPIAEKNFFYATNVLLVGFPVTIVGWVESTQCSAFVRDTFFGHLLYDGYIAVALTVWYLVCYMKVRSESGKVKIA